MFTTENTSGYTQEQLDALNAELETRLAGIEPETDEYYQTEKSFSDEVARRTPQQAKGHSHHCSECGAEVEEFCADHPSASVDSITSAAK